MKLDADSAPSGSSGRTRIPQMSLDQLPADVQALVAGLVEKKMSDLRKDVRKEMDELKRRDTMLNNTIQRQAAVIGKYRTITQMYEKARISHTKTRSFEQKAVQVDLRGAPEPAHPAPDDEMQSYNLSVRDGMPGKKHWNSMRSGREGTLPAIHENQLSNSRALSVIGEPGGSSRSTQDMDLDTGHFTVNGNGHAIERFEPEMGELSDDSDICDLEGLVDPETLASIKSNLTICKKEK